jgi:hypothetical protein
VFLLVTVIMGGCTAFVSGKAIAETWRPVWHALAYALIIGLAARFIHFALFEEVLVSLRNYLVDCAVLILAAIAGYLVTRRRQMTEQYESLHRATTTTRS